MPTLLVGISLEEKAQAATPCHGEPMGDDAGDMTFMTDCMEIVMFSIDDDALVKRPDQQIDKIVYARVNETLSYSLLAMGQNAIRGPPGWEQARNTNFSLILTTQRFRI